MADEADLNSAMYPRKAVGLEPIGGRIDVPRPGTLA